MPTIAQDRSVRTYDKAGHLHVEMARVSKANICPYLGSEIPEWQALGLDPGRVYALLRDPAELEKAARTFSGKPIVLKHRPQMADDHDRDITVGAMGEVVWDAPYLCGPMSIWDGAGIEAIETGQQRQLSCGYFYRADMTPGEFEGEPYDGRMVDIAGNHVALVDTGRAGPDVFVGDHLPLEIQDMPVLSRKAALVKGALSEFLRPKLAADQSLALSPLLRDVTAKNWGATKPKLVDALKVAVKGKLAQDADIEDVVEMLDRLEDVAEEVADEMEPKPAVDSDPDAETEEERKERLARRAAAKAVADKTPPAVTQAAMDAALAKTARDVETATVARLTALHEAKDEVKTILGGHIALDSAEAVYGEALKQVGVDTAGVHPSAYRAMVQMHLKSQERRPALAADAAMAEGFSKRFGTSVPLKHL